MSKTDKLTSLINEMKYPDIIESAKESVQMFNKEIYKILPESDYTIESGYSGALTPSIGIDFLNVGKEDHMYNKRNSTINSSFLIYLTSSSRDSKNPEYKNSSFEVKLINRVFPEPLKFETITGKTPIEAMNNLLQWFKKNKDVIDSIPKFREKPLGS